MTNDEINRFIAEKAMGWETISELFLIFFICGVLGVVNYALVSLLIKIIKMGG